MGYNSEWAIPILTTLSKFNDFTGGLENTIIALCLFVWIIPLLSCSFYVSFFQEKHRSNTTLFSIVTAFSFVIFSLLIANLLSAHPRNITWPVPSEEYQVLSLSNDDSSSAAPRAPPPPIRSELFSDEEGHFIDSEKRIVFFRGVNLGGNSKLPTRNSTSTPSFSNRPIPLKEADDHLRRLRSWGYTLLRLVIPWEAVEPSVPGLYDQDYLRYLNYLLEKIGEYDMRVIIDPHQDVWSRFTGGSGCPLWTLEMVGFNVSRLHSTGSAHLHSWNDDDDSGETKKKKEESMNMMWFMNHGRLATSTMFTLFFAGEEFAPNLSIDGENIQTFLQRHFIAAMVQVANIAKRFPHVIGFETLNEPGNGFVGTADLEELKGFPIGWKMTPFQSILLGSGYAQRNVSCFKAPFVLGEDDVTLNPEGETVWRNDAPLGGCIWKAHGVWGVEDVTGKPVLYKSDYFAFHRHRGDDDDDQTKQIRFHEDYVMPFFNSYAKKIRAEIPGAFIFANPHLDIVNLVHDLVAEDENNEKGRSNDTIIDTERFAWAPHYYDGLSLITRTFRTWITLNPITERPLLGGPTAKLHQRVHTDFLSKLKRASSSLSGHSNPVPTIVTETGIPFDLFQGQYSYKNNRNFDIQITAMDALLESFEMTHTNFILWNYNIDNTNDRGDHWNGEDFSIFSKDQRKNPSDLHSGGRALPAIVRPYPARVAGMPLTIRFDAKQRYFVFSFRHDDENNDENDGKRKDTLLFVPQYQYPPERGGPKIDVSDGEYEFVEQEQTLIYRHSTTVDVHTIEIRPSSLIGKQKHEQEMMEHSEI